jgi:TrmH family RNA methyltransferase
LLGSEAHGLADEWVERADRRVTIPMQPGVDSLNLAVAAGILLYQASRGFRTT